MKKRLFSILFCSILAVVCAIGLTACKKSNKQIYEKPEVSSYVFNKTEKIDGLDGYHYVDSNDVGASSDNLYLFSKENDDLSLTLKLYNYTQNKVVEEKTVSLEKASAIYAITYEEYDYYAVIDTVEGEGDEDTYKFTLKNASGETLATIEQDSLYFNANIDLLFFEKEIYRFNKGGIELVKKINELDPVSIYSNFCVSTKKYYYSTDPCPYVAVYDKDLNLVNTTRVLFDDMYEGFIGYGVLNNGNVISQYKEYLEDQTTKDFTYIDDDGYKFKVYTFIVNPVNGKVKEIDSNVLFDGGPGFVSSKDIKFGCSECGSSIKNNGIFNEKLLNLAFGYEIVNKRLAGYKTLFALSNNGKATKIDAPKGLVGNYSVYPMPNGRLIGYDNSGNYVISDAELKDFKLISEYAFEAIDENGNRKYFATEKAVYDYDFNEVFDLSDEDTEIIDFLDEGFIYSVYDSEKDETKYYLFNNGESKEIEGLVDVVGCFYITEAEGEKINVCNEAGVLFANVEDVDFESVVFNTDNTILISIDGSFYRLSVEVPKK